MRLPGFATGWAPAVAVAVVMNLLPTPMRSAGQEAAATASPSPADSAAFSASPAPAAAAGYSASPGFRLPVPPPAQVLTPFRPPAERWGRGHRGVDLAAPAGSVVRSAGAGTVAYAGWVVDRFVVSVQHTPSLRTTYEPVRPLVAAGQRVDAGQPVGVLGSGHRSCAPADCLHWGARVRADTYLDPLRLLRSWRVRLKPWAGLSGGD